MIRDIFVYTMWHICGKELNRTLSEEVLWTLSVEMKKNNNNKMEKSHSSLSVSYPNNTSGNNTEIKVNGQKLETVTSFKYLGSVITDEGSKPEILSRIAQATAELTRLKPVWIDKSISLSSKI